MSIDFVGICKKVDTLNIWYRPFYTYFLDFFSLLRVIFVIRE